MGRRKGGPTATQLAGVRLDGKPRIGHNYKPKAMAEIRALLEIGKTNEEISEILVDKFGYTQLYARTLINEEKKSFEKYYEEVRQNIMDINVKRLNSLIYRLTAKGDDKLVLQAIDLLNKTIGGYEQKIKVTGDQPIFEIKVGDEQ